MERTAAAASPLPSVSPARSRGRSSRIVMSGSAPRRHRGAAGDQPEEIPEQLLPVRREDRLGMELHSPRLVRLMTKRHDLVLGSPRDHLESRRETLARHEERMVAGRLEGIVDVEEDAAAVVDHGGGLAVDEALRAYVLSAEHLADALVTEADAKDRDRSRGLADELLADPRVVGPAGPWRDHDRVGGHREGVLHGDLVVPDHLRHVAQLSQVLNQIPGEGVVVVDHQDHASSPPAARRTASSTARPLFRVSTHSSSGLESATMPAPTPRCTRPPSNVAVRIVMQKSAFPWKSKYPMAPA